MTKKIFIHIGTYKTGTSSIQHEAFTSPELETSGVHYVRAGLNKMFEKHLRLYDSIIDDGFNTNRRNKPGYKCNYEIIKNNLAKEIMDGQSPCYFISEEELSYPEPSIAEHLAFLNGLGEVRVLFVVRRQDHFLDSLYRQFVREYDRAIEMPFKDFVRDELVAKRADFFTIAESWAGVFGRENIQVVDMDVLRSGGDLVTQFFRWSGMPYTPTTAPKVINPSLSAAESEVIRRLRCRWRMDDQGFDKIVRIFKAIEKKYSASYLSGGIDREILAKYQSCNEKLKDVYAIAFAGADDLPVSELQVDFLTEALRLEEEVSDAEIFVIEHFMNKITSAIQVLS